VEADRDEHPVRVKQSEPSHKRTTAGGKLQHQVKEIKSSEGTVQWVNKMKKYRNR